MNEILREGKTKRLFAVPGIPGATDIKSLDIVTWGNEHRAPMKGKGVWETTTLVTHFHLMRRAGLTVAFISGMSPTVYRAPFCKNMIQLEVVGRIIAEGSYCARNQNVAVGTPLEKPVIEFFLKSSKGEFEGSKLPADDPFIRQIDPDGVWVVDPGKPVTEKGVFIPAQGIGVSGDLQEACSHFAYFTARAIRTIAEPWTSIGWSLADLKIEFDAQGFIADGVSADSMRIKDPDGIERSKQTVRNEFKAGVPQTQFIANAQKNYAMIAMAAEQFV